MEHPIDGKRDLVAWRRTPPRKRTETPGVGKKQLFRSLLRRCFALKFSGSG